jgi:asparagine synthetase B (glutamine-hydrolysing)
MMSDVPYGALSGGLILLSLQKICAKRIESDDSRSVSTAFFSVGLEGSPDLAAAQK